MTQDEAYPYCMSEIISQLKTQNSTSFFSSEKL